MNAPQIILIAIWMLQALLHASKNGELKEPEKYSLATVIVRIIIFGSLLTWGGFFPWPT